MDRILAGIETEYGLLLEGRGAEDQVEDAMALVRSYPCECFANWDYRYESPRADLRGFSVSRLAVDPVDAQFDKGRKHGSDHEVRSDRILPNGARFYNDHGHPEYATPECWSLKELSEHDKAGEYAVLLAARALEEQSGRKISIYKNNTDFHGASYGTHESYLVPRSLGFENLYAAVTPMLVARQILCGAGKVGYEHGRSCFYQLSQRADFFVEPHNVETLFRRPVFNTRDEAHANPAEWVRLHVICGDANMMIDATARKVGLVKLALQLAVIGEAPVWRLRDPVAAFQNISKDEIYEFKVELQGKSWTNAFEIIESYLAAAEQLLDLSVEEITLVAECRELMASLKGNFTKFASHVDWAAKKVMLEHFMESEGTDWRDPNLRAYDLEYHNVNNDESLFYALSDIGLHPVCVEPSSLEHKLDSVLECTRAFARGVAVTKHKEHLANACWRSLTFNVDGKLVEIELPPDREYPAQLAEAGDVGTFINILGG